MISGLYRVDSQLNDDAIWQVRAEEFHTQFTKRAAIGVRYKHTFVAFAESINNFSGKVELAEDQTTGLSVLAWARIDNSAELCSELGISAPTTAADLILKLYSRWGDASANRLIGDFVFAVFDAKQHVLCIYRDKFGTRPLYYSLQSGCFAFAVLPRDILTLTRFDFSPSIEWMAAYVARLRPSTNATAFDELAVLEAGQRLRVSNRGVQVDTYWRPSDLITGQSLPEADLIETYRASFSEAVRCRLGVAERVGLELSGGLDSSSIACVAAREKQSSQQLHSFAYSYFDNEMDNLTAANRQACVHLTHLRLSPISALIERQNVARYIDKAGLPPEHMLAMNATDLMQTAADNRVFQMLSGYGGDEFCTAMGAQVVDQMIGERRYSAAYKRLAPTPVGRLRRVSRLFKPRPLKHPSLPKFLTVSARSVLDSQWEISVNQSNTWQTHNDYLLGRWYQLGSGRLNSYTLAAASFGLTYAWPFLDERLVSLYLNAAVDQRLGRNANNRWLHRRALRSVLPSQVFQKNTKAIGAIAPSLRTSRANSEHDAIEAPHELINMLVDLPAMLTKTDTGAQRELNRQAWTRVSILDRWLKQL